MISKHQILLALTITLQLLATLGLQLVVVSVLGASRDTDLFIAAQAVPIMVFAVLSVPLQNLWYATLSTRAGEPQQWRPELACALGQCSVIFGVVALALAASASVWLPILLPGFTPDEHSHTQSLTHILLLATFLNGHNAIYMLGMRSRGQFFRAEAINAAASVGALLICLWFVRAHGIEVAAWAVLMRSVATAVALCLYCDGTLPALLRGLKAPGHWRNLALLVSGTSICETVTLVDRYLGSLATAGGMTTYNLARQGITSVATVVDRAVVAPFTPDAARHIETQDFGRVREDHRDVLKRIFFCMLLTAIGLAVAYPGWEWALGRALQLSAPLAEQAWLICAGLVIYIFLAPAIGADVALLFALGKTRTPMAISVTTFVIESSLKVLMFRWLGLPGLALATSLALCTNFGLCRWSAHRAMNLAESGK